VFISPDACVPKMGQLAKQGKKSGVADASVCVAIGDI
jgi:hypothetical protein